MEAIRRVKENSSFHNSIVLLALYTVHNHELFTLYYNNIKVRPTPGQFDLYTLILDKYRQFLSEYVINHMDGNTNLTKDQVVNYYGQAIKKRG